MEKSILITIGFIIGVFIIFWLLVTHVFAHTTNYTCGGGDYEEVWQQCPVSPTPTQEVTPTDIPTATPSAAPCTENCGNSPTFEGSTTTAHPATCNGDIVASPLLQGYKTEQDGSRTFSWWPSTTDGISKQSVIFGYTPDSLVYGADNLPSSQTSITLKGLDESKSVWAQVWSWKGECVGKSAIIDP